MVVVAVAVVVVAVVQSGLFLILYVHGLKALQTLTGLVILLVSLSPANILNILNSAGIDGMDRALTDIMTLLLHLRLSVQMVGGKYARMEKYAVVCSMAAAFTSTR